MMNVLRFIVESVEMAISDSFIFSCHFTLPPQMLEMAPPFFPVDRLGGFCRFFSVNILLNGNLLLRPLLLGLASR
jgi:hypothetical protein